MAALEEREVPEQTEETISVEASAPSSLTEKLLVLSSKLRTAGYELQAEELEGKIALYKKAETDANLLYRAHSETGDDLLESAHPDGDVEIAPAQDQHGHVETPISEHKKIIDIVTKPVAGTKAMALDMLKKTLNIKTAQIPLGKEQREIGFKEYEPMIEEIVKTIQPVVANLFDNPKYDVKLTSGKTIGQWKEEINRLIYNTSQSVGQYREYVNSNDVRNKSAALQWPDTLLKKVIEMSNDIHKSRADGTVKTVAPDSKEKGFDNPTFDTSLKALATNLQHRWYKFWSKYGGGKTEDAEYHGKFLTPGELSQMLAPQKVKLEHIKSFINDFLLISPEVKSSPQIAAYLGGMIKFIDGMGANFDSIAKEAQNFVNGKASVFGSNAEITMDNVKGFISDKSLLSKLNFTSSEAFSNSLSEVYAKLMSNLYKLVNENDAFNSNKDQILQDLEARKQRISSGK